VPRYQPEKKSLKRAVFAFKRLEVYTVKGGYPQVYAQVIHRGEMLTGYAHRVNPRVE
jgi:hypothetical protein